MNKASSAVASPRVATYQGLLQAIRETRAASQARIETAVEQEKVREAWETGKLIDEHILLHKERADYGEQILKRLSGDLAVSETELGYIVQFSRTYPISPPAEKLSWAHYRELLSMNDSKEREEVTKRAVKEHWNREQVREEIQRRQHGTQAPAKLPVITPGPPYTYQIIRLKDRLKIDLGFGITMAQRVRLRRIDAPEIESAEGKEAKAYLKKVLSRDPGRILMKSVDIDQHGRPLADVWVKNKPVDQELLDQGLAVRLEGVS